MNSFVIFVLTAGMKQHQERCGLHITQTICGMQQNPGHKIGIRRSCLPLRGQSIMDPRARQRGPQRCRSQCPALGMVSAGKRSRQKHSFSPGSLARGVRKPQGNVQNWEEQALAARSPSERQRQNTACGTENSFRQYVWDAEQDGRVLSVSSRNQSFLPVKGHIQKSK